MRKRTLLFVIGAILLAAAAASAQAPARPAVDPVVQKIIELGTTDNRVMTWNDYASNRFGGRESGTNAYNDATAWAVWQFREWGLEAELDPAGEVPVGFNRGPWFGKMLKPVEKALYFGTPSFTAGTKGLERGPVVILKSDPFSIPGRNATPENVEKKRAAAEAAIAEVRANAAAFKGAWVLIPGQNTGFARDGRRGTPEYADAKLIPPLTAALIEAGARGTIQLSKTDPFPMLDGFVESWDKLPVLPDIKLAEGQYNEIKGLVEKGEPVELEFDIRNWFKMGPVKYHSVVATAPRDRVPRRIRRPRRALRLLQRRDRRRRRRLGLRPGHGGHPAHPGRRRPAQAVHRRRPLRGRGDRSGRLPGLAQEPARTSPRRSS